MFPMTHISFSKAILGYSNTMTVLGAIFPDITITKCLTYEQTHKCGWGLFDFIIKHYPECTDFAKAMVTHTVDPKGLDYYGDEDYTESIKNGFCFDAYEQKSSKGYCFLKGAKIVEEVIEACNLPREYGLWKAHNFIEMGIEINALTKEPELSEMLHEGLNDFDIISKISKPLKHYYKLEGDYVFDCFRKFADFIEVEKSDSYILASKYDIQMKTKHGISINIEKSAKIIEKCRTVAEEDFLEFIEFSTKKITDMLEMKKV